MPSNRSLSENEPFITLIQVAREDRAIRRKLVHILNLDKFHRTSVLHYYLGALRQDAAPDELISAVSSLLDPEVADKTLQILSSVISDD